MCFNYKVSLLTFFIGTVGSYILIKYGNIQFYKENMVYGIFLIFIAGIQFMDFLFWIDLDNKIGINKIVTIFGPLFNVGQPLILYIIKLIYFKEKDLLSFKNLPILILNLLYCIYLFTSYFKFLNESALVTKTNHGHLKWPWIDYYNPTYYLILLGINIFYLMNFKYSLIFFIITYIFLILSCLFFSYNPGELWCFFGSFIPILMFLASYFIH
jgi:hypothetical protein